MFNFSLLYLDWKKGALKCISNYHTKWSKSESKIWICIISLTCEISNMTQMDLSPKQKQTHRHREQICGCQGIRKCERDGMGGWD